MSFIVKGIDLPEKNKGLYVYIFNGKAEVVHPLDACELVHINGEAIQIPKSHGDIKDTNTIFTYGIWEKRAVNEAPTILEVEE